MKLSELFDFASYLISISHCNNPTPFTFRPKSDILIRMRHRGKAEEQEQHSGEEIIEMNSEVFDSAKGPDHANLIAPKVLKTTPDDALGPKPRSMQSDSIPEPLSAESALGHTLCDSVAEPTSPLDALIPHPMVHVNSQPSITHG